MANHELVLQMLGAAARVTRRLDRSLSSIKGISFSEYQLLLAIQERPGSSATRVDLADDVCLTASGVTRALKPLERLGFVTTVKDDRDARRSLAQLTPAGIELVADAAGVVDDTLSELDAVAALSGSEQQRFGRLLRELSRG